MKKQVLLISLLALVIFCAPAQATHIQYFSYTDLTTDNPESFSESDDTWNWTFDLTEDDMELWDIDTNTSLADGSYNPDYALHYVTLRIDPNNYTGSSTSNYIGLTVNGQKIEDWANPIRLYDWGVPGGSVDDPYGIADNGFKITVTLTGLDALRDLGENKLPLDITNVNLEGCFDDAAPVPEPSTLLLLGAGLVGLAGWRYRKSHQRSR